MNLAVLISGGVDSAVTVHRLCEQGHKPDLYYIKIGMEADGLTCTAEEDIELSTATARMYGLSLHIVDLQQAYWESVVGYVVERARQGLTPNPDVMCNKLIKFGVFEERIGRHYDTVATGHYATLRTIDGRRWLCTAKDPVKDQTDFLAQLDSRQIGKLMFPIGELTKAEVREIATRHRLPSARRKDSQGICFLGKINYNDFIRRCLGERRGDVVEWETGRRLGTHNGHWFHTIGQRKGLGLGGGPWFVVKKDIEQNVIYVSRGAGTSLPYGRTFRLPRFHFITGNPWEGQDAPQRITFKIRHTDTLTAGTLTPEGAGVRVQSDEPVQGIAPGQFGVIYDEKSERCIGSGEIRL